MLSAPLMVLKEARNTLRGLMPIHVPVMLPHVVLHHLYTTDREQFGRLSAGNGVVG